MLSNEHYYCPQSFEEKLYTIWAGNNFILEINEEKELILKNTYSGQDNQLFYLRNPFGKVFEIFSLATKKPVAVKTTEQQEYCSRFGFIRPGSHWNPDPTLAIQGLGMIGCREELIRKWSKDLFLGSSSFVQLQKCGFIPLMIQKYTNHILKLIVFLEQNIVNYLLFQQRQIKRFKDPIFYHWKESLIKCYEIKNNSTIDSIILQKHSEIIFIYF